MPFAVPVPELILQGQAYELLADWIGQVEQPVHARVERQGVRITVTVEPTQLSLINLTPITVDEARVRYVVAHSPRRLLAREIAHAMKDEKPRIAFRTLRRHLAAMVKAGHLDNPGRRAGYGIPGRDYSDLSRAT